MANELNFDISEIKKLITDIDNNLDALHEKGEDIPCIEGNVRQMKALLNMLKIEFMDI